MQGLPLHSTVQTQEEKADLTVILSKSQGFAGCGESLGTVLCDMDSRGHLGEAKIPLIRRNTPDLPPFRQKGFQPDFT